MARIENSLASRRKVAAEWYQEHYQELRDRETRKEDRRAERKALAERKRLIREKSIARAARKAAKR